MATRRTAPVDPGPEHHPAPGTDAAPAALRWIPVADVTVDDRPGTALVPWTHRDLALPDPVRVARIQAGQRARRLPFVVTAATAAAGYTGWGLAELAAAATGPTGTLAATSATAAACAAGVVALRVAFRHSIPLRWRRRWWTAGTAASAWVTTAAAIGPASWPMSATLALGAVATSAAWLAEHEVPRPSHALVHPLVPLAPAVVDDTSTILARRWADNIAARPGGVLPGALLTDQQTLPRAIRWTVQTPAGSISFAEVLSRRPKIAAGLRQPIARVLVEPGPDEASFVLTVVTSDALADGVPYAGPRYVSDHARDGRIPLGSYADGTGEAYYVAVDGVGPRNGMATGEPGSGKSAFLETVALGLRASRRWVLLFGDGDPEGGSSPLLHDLADWAAAGPHAVLTQLQALEAVLEVRGMLKATLTADPDTGLPVPISDPASQQPVRELLPCPAIPGITWQLDELHRLASDPFLAEQRFFPRVERIARIGRKYGVVILTGSQSLLVGDYGNSTPLRGMLSSRNLFAFRNQNKTETSVVAGLEISPSTLPAGGGYAYAGGSGRLAMLRVAWSRDMARHASGLPRTRLDADSARALDAHRPAAASSPAERHTEAVAKLAAWRAGTLQPHDTSSASGGSPTNAARPGTGGGLADLVIPAALTDAAVIPLHPRPAAPDDGHGVLADLNATQRAVYDALHAGHRRTGDIAAATGTLAPSVSKALAVLAEHGLARKVAHGEWTAAPHDTRAG